MPAKINLELLFHHRCDHCNKWWSVSDLAPQIGKEVVCQHCDRPTTLGRVEYETSVKDSDEILKLGELLVEIGQGIRDVYGRHSSGRPLPKKGDKYLHWKGEQYEIWNVLRCKEAPKGAIHIGFVTHTETLEHLHLYGLGEEYYIFNPSYLGERFVLYWCKGSQWARPLDNFLETLGDKEEGTMFYRFQRVDREVSSIPGL